MELELNPEDGVDGVDGASPKSYISYFQTVTTIGIITTASSADEATFLAQQRMKTGLDGGITGGIFSQTPYTLYITEEIDARKN